MSTDRAESRSTEAETGRRILLVEDDPGTQDLIRALCESRGDSVDTAADGFLGLRLLSERRHDIVLIDYHLPEMDGYALARLMRELGRPEGRVGLIGITADRHGLASRRGADTLFDAILVKPLGPQSLFATLDRLARPEPASAQIEPADPANALWLRRGLAGRPRAFLCPKPTAAETEAVSQVFALAESPADADLVLFDGEAGLADLRALRNDGPAGLLPAFDLTGRFGAACDGLFQVGNPESWSALARTSLAFGERRFELSAATLSAQDAKTRLAALMFVADRSLRLDAGDTATGAAYETGYAKTALMAAVLQLMEEGALTCEPFAGGVSATLTPAGRDFVTKGSRVEPEGGRVVTTTGDAGSMSDAQPLAARDPLIGATSGAPAAMPVNVGTLQELNALVGSRQVELLLARLSQMLDAAFPPKSDRQAIAREAHTLISTAGSLGFDRLSQACRELQDAIATGADETSHLRDARHAIVDARKLCAQGVQLLSLTG